MSQRYLLIHPVSAMNGVISIWPFKEHMAAFVRGSPYVDGMKHIGT